MSESYQIYPLGDSALMVEFGQQISASLNQQILQKARHLENQHYPWLDDIVPAYTTLTIFYNPLKVEGSFPYGKVKKMIERELSSATDEEELSSRHIRIPVCYGGEFGPDLEEVASMNGLQPGDVVKIHTDPLYRVFFLGFSPGFPFLGGMDGRIAAPRKKVPRKKIPEGAVGIAGQQTGIYTQEGPGGWQIIGRTPLSLFSVSQNPPALIMPGDTVSFVPISREEFYNWEGTGWE